MQQNTLAEVIALSKSNPDQIYTLYDGRVIINGRVFKNKQELEGTIKMMAKMDGLKTKIKKLFKFSNK